MTEIKMIVQSFSKMHFNFYLKICNPQDKHFGQTISRSIYTGK